MKILNLSLISFLAIGLLLNTSCIAAENDTNKNLSIKQYNKLLEKDYENANYYYERGKLYLKHHKNQKAMMDFYTAYNINPKYKEAYICRGLSYFFDKDYGNAFETFKNLEKNLPNETDGYYYQGLLYSMVLYDDESAVKCFSKAIEINPNDISLYNNRGMGYKMLDKYNEAICDFTKVVEKTNNIDDKISALKNRSECYTKLNQNENAQKDKEEFEKLTITKI